MGLEIKVATSSGLENLNAGDPVALLLHGYGADERDLPSIMNYLPPLPWVSLRAPQVSEYGGYAWYPISTPLEPSELEVSAPTQAIWDWIDANLPEDAPLILIGFSQGGLMATQLLRSRPSRIAATVILAGFVYHGVMPGDSELSQTKPKVIYCRGLEDQRISREAVASLNTWLQSHTRAITKTYDGLGHSIDERVLADVAAYLESQSEKNGWQL